MKQGLPKIFRSLFFWQWIIIVSCKVADMVVFCSDMRATYKQEPPMKVKHKHGV